MTNRFLCLNLFVILMLLVIHISQIKCSKEGTVYEMDDRLIEFTAQGKWLIMFYAPWCGHCKKLTPVFDELAAYYKGNMINIAKVDATRFLKATNHFEIRGYPTVKFIYGKQNVNYNGERKKEDLVLFVERCDAPQVSLAHSELEFENIKYEKPIFFLFVGRNDDEDALRKEYFDLAAKHFVDAFFYYTHPDYIRKTVKINITPRIGVVKDSEFTAWDPSQHSMERFIQLEQFLTFCEVSLTNFHNLIETRKMLVVLIIDLNDEKLLPQNRKLKQAFKIYAKTNKRSYQKDFYLGYTENHELFNGIAIWTLPKPTLFILNTTSYQFTTLYLLETNHHIIDYDIDIILKDIRENNVEWYGGQTMFRTMRRPLWELYRAIIEMFIEAPLISLLIFGFPFGVISIVCYFLCCVDSNDEPDEDEPRSDDSEEEEEHHNYLEEDSKLYDRAHLINDDMNVERVKIPIPPKSKKTQ